MRGANMIAVSSMLQQLKRQHHFSNLAA